MSRIWMPGGAGGADLDVVTAGAGDVLKGKVIVEPDGEPLTGTLALSGDAGDSMVLSGKTYYNTDPKQKRTGDMANQGAKTAALNCGGSYTIPAGYHNGKGKVTANSLAAQTDANAAAGDILSGKNAWVKGSKISGSMGSMNGQTITPGSAQQTIFCSGKKMNGNIVVNAIPGNFVDVTANQTVFNNGVCSLATRAYPKYINWLDNVMGGKPHWAASVTDLMSPFLIGYKKLVSANYFLLDGTIDLTPFKTITILATVELSDSKEYSCWSYLKFMKHKEDEDVINISGAAFGDRSTNNVKVTNGKTITLTYDISSITGYRFIALHGTVSFSPSDYKIKLKQVILKP